MAIVRKRSSLLISVLFAPALFADVQYQQTAKMTGGSLMQMMKFLPGAGQMKEPQVSTVVFQGNRMARRNAHTGEIVDLDAKTITNINFDKKTYSSMTFQQMKDMLAKMSEQQAGADGKSTADIKFDVDMKETGQTRNISGMDAREFLMTIAVAGTDAKSGATGAMKIDSNMWIAANVPGGAEIRSFYERMAKEIDWAPTGMGAMMNRPDLQRAMAKMMAEGGKMKGTSILQTTRVYGDMTGMPAAQANAQGTPARPSMQEALGGALGGRLAGLGGFGRKKAAPEAPVENASATGAGTAPGNANSLLEMTIESTDFKESEVDTTLFQVPAGFKEVQEDPSSRMPRRR